MNISPIPERPVRAVLFDLDGTLVRTERLKAISYARAATALRPEVREADVVRAFGDVVGLARQAVADRLMQRFQLEEPARRRMADLNAATPAEAYIALRLREYDAMLEEPQAIRDEGLSDALALVADVRQRGLPRGLVTVSHRYQVDQILMALELEGVFDPVLTIEDVTRPKPDPEVYQVALTRLALPAEQCMAVEDSAPGIRSALAAGLRVLAVPSGLTRPGVDALGHPPGLMLVQDPSSLVSLAAEWLGGAKG